MLADPVEKAMTQSCTVAVMQPYLFPYFPYFQLVRSANYFIILDTVKYRRRGYINRNMLLIKGEQIQFTFPVAKQSRNSLIKDVRLGEPAQHHTKKLLVTLDQAYGASQNWQRCSKEVANILDRATGGISLVELAVSGLKFVTSYLGISTQFKLASDLSARKPGSTASDYIMALVHELGGDRYINSIGGQSLYSGEEFEAAGIELRYLKSDCIAEPESSVSGCSILTDLAECSRDELAAALPHYSLVTG